MIRVYNTLSQSKEAFEPVTPGKVGIYLCGPTVYKPSHIGHMVGPVIFDTIKRYLVYSGYDVTLRGQHHRRRRQAHRRVEPARRAHGPTGRRDDRRLHGQPRTRWASIRSTSFPAATDNIDEIIKLTADAGRKGLRLRVRRRRLLRRRQVRRTTASSAAADGRGHAGRRRRHGRAEALQRPISPCGRRPSRTSPRGPAPGATAGPAGTSSAPP